MTRAPAEDLFSGSRAEAAGREDAPLKLSFITLTSLWDVKFGLWGRKFKSKEPSGKTCCVKPPLLPDLETSADHPELFGVPANTEIGAKSTHLTYRPRISFSELLTVALTTSRSVTSLLSLPAFRCIPDPDLRTRRVRRADALRRLRRQDFKPLRPRHDGARDPGPSGRTLRNRGLA